MKEDLWFTGRDQATLRELKEGAIAVFAGCMVRDRKGGVSRYQGGSLPSISTSNRLYHTLSTHGTASKAYYIPGANGNLEVTLEAYDPRNVHCGGGPGPPYESCARLLTHYYPSKTEYIFGRQGEEGVEMPLPNRAVSGIPYQYLHFAMR